MRELLDDLVHGVAPGICETVEARFVALDDEELRVRNGRIDRVERSTSEGVGIRVRVDGAYGFAATRELTRPGLERTLARAVELARGAARAPGGRPTAFAAALAPLGPIDGTWRSPCDRDPFDVALEDKLAHLTTAEAALRGHARIATTEASCSSRRLRTVLAVAGLGTCSQDRVECGAGIGAIATQDGDVQVRSYPSAHGGSIALAGWEHVVALDLAGHAPRVAAEAVELLAAPVCPEGRATLVLGSEQLALQVHESIGHALELDRMLLGEASYAGTSWVTPADLGTLRYGSEQLSITADATLPGGLGTYGWDDEGVPATRTPLIEDGLLRAALSDRVSAAAVGLDRAGGCARADGFARQPIVRMTNVSIEPGTAGSLDDLVADTGEGLYLETNRSWSIDDRRLHFQFGCEVAREIRGGELGRLLRDPSYAGVTPGFWSSLDAVCSQADWTLWGLVNCGKGEPGQVMRVSHGAAPARFRDVQVGVA